MKRINATKINNYDNNIGSPWERNHINLDSIISNNQWLDPFYETLIDRILDVIGKRHISNIDKNINQIIDNINLYTSKNNINIIFNSNSSELNSKIYYENNKWTVELYFNNTHNIKNAIHLLLHEISHIITIKSSNFKLKMKLINSHNVDINNIKHLKEELDYFLSPNEAANWAFTISLSMYEHKYNPQHLYTKIKEEIIFKNVKLNSKLYKDLDITLKPFYHVIFYTYQLKNLNIKKTNYKSYRNKLNHFVKLINKYTKRLELIIGKSS